nr:hypothetical protein [Lachnospiraceae bacterium]
MNNSDVNDYLLEKKIENESPVLHENMHNNIVVLNHMLNSYTTIFPFFTDHSVLHSMDVLDYCNSIIGADNIKRLNVDECYVIVMSCYLHDIGMGVREKDYLEFMPDIVPDDYIKKHGTEDRSRIIRDFHNEFSGHFIKKQADFFEIPTKEHLFAIIQTSRGHRKTDLYDEKEYPDVILPNGNVIRTVYTSAIVRIADEIDVASDRNPELL